MMTRQLLSITVVLLSVAPLTAQAERITIRMAPAPGQTFRARASQQMTMTGEPETAADAPARAPATIVINITTDVTSTIGLPNEQHQYEARITADTGVLTMTVNGQPASLPSALTSPTAAQSVTMTYTADGVFVGMAGLPDSPAIASAQALLGAAIGTGPLVLAVGETTTRPINVGVPMPMAGATASVTAALTGTFTLTSLNTVDGRRIAHLTTETSGSLSQPLPALAAGTVVMELQATGHGSMDVDLDRGIAIVSETVTTLEGVMKPPAGSGAPAIHIHGTVTIGHTLID
jgi:hypothetical protein